MTASPKTIGKLGILLAGLALAGVILLLFGADSKVNRQNIDYLQSFGWQVDEAPEEISHLTVPEDFDAVFQAYSRTLQEGGFDLNACRGVRATRYTYRVRNHQSSESETIRIQVFVTRKGIIAAHICSLSPNGFVRPVSDTSGQL